MSFSVTRNGSSVEITVEGQLVISNRQELKQAVIEELERGARHFRIDFERTLHIDSSGLGVLISLSKRIREARGELRLARINDDLKSLFRLTKLDKLFRVDDDDGTASRSAELKPRPLGPLDGNAQVDPLPPDTQI